MMDPLPSKGRLIGSGALSRFTAQHKELVRRRHSLAPETVEKPPNDHIFTRNRRSFVFSSTGNAGNSPIVAIDSKIEQAMDLVKTHLMFAVREEVEVLRNKILALETTIIQLEAENAVLREHVPAEVLQNMTAATSSPPPQPNTAVAAQ